ncbi:MAG: DUF3034 family protein [Xanthomonadales bacterium]|nr:DUF3034 family protein [Xanthomonadales bacterium]
MRRPESCLLLVLALVAAPIHADGSRLLATGGVVPVEGGGGGGIVPWAVLSGYGSETEAGGSVTYSRLDTDDYAVAVYAAAYSWDNRLELSLARQEFELGTLRRLIGLAPNAKLRQNIVGLKYRVTGDVVYTPWPQISLGVQYKKNLDPAVPLAVGARDDADFDAYVSACKLFLASLAQRNLLTCGTLRYTRANQGGLLGFGGDGGTGRELHAEVAVALLLNRRFAVGAEYRSKPDNLGFAREDRWYDLFAAWFPSKRWSVTAAHVDLGSIAGLTDQTGVYVSAQLNW